MCFFIFSLRKGTLTLTPGLGMGGGWWWWWGGPSLQFIYIYILYINIHIYIYYIYHICIIIIYIYWFIDSERRRTKELWANIVNATNVEVLLHWRFSIRQTSLFEHSFEISSATVRPWEPSRSLVHIIKHCFVNCQGWKLLARFVKMWSIHAAMYNNI